ncbi:hypothetical protein E3N88_19966 [Mikania micrantha]|uniref:PWWP domain-containing protein n=1 Tax=Mikania micrantha TaxID=192012 RepID=A0A5N6NG55_9ASTR|nr:hypothetical protein E3N88_19966 [Mikania micrantha]
MTLVLSWIRTLLESGQEVHVCEHGKKRGRTIQKELDHDEEEDHSFVVGDFVWGKIKSHSWWPGQVSMHLIMQHNGQLLVAYFGDGSFSWCSPSQLKPFLNHFQDMLCQSKSKKFVNAVHQVLEEVVGACAPKGSMIKGLMDQMVPVELVSTLKGGYFLVDYYDPKCIEGLEEEVRSRVVADSDIITQSGSPDNGDDKLYQKGKQKAEAVDKCGGGVEEETMSPRQRKKSTYLLPPYLSPTRLGKLLVLGSEHRELDMYVRGWILKDIKRDADMNVTVVLNGLLCDALYPSFLEKNVPEILYFRSSIFKEGNRSQTDKRKAGEANISELAFIKQKLEWMSEMAHMCEENEMSADVKASLDVVIQHVLE